MATKKTKAKPSGQDAPLLTQKERRTINAMVELGQKDPQGIQNALVSRALTLCPLPYRKPKESQLVRQTKLPIGSLCVAFSDMTVSKQLAYGDDALLLDLLASEARRRGERVIAFKTAQDLLVFAGIRPDAAGNFGGNLFKLILQRVERLRRLGIAVHWNEPDGRMGPLNIYRVFSRSYTPSATDSEREAFGEHALFPYFLEFSEEFFEELMSHYRAIPRDVLLNFQGNPTEYAIAKWIVDRVQTARSVSTVSLEALRDERGSGDSNLRRYKQQVYNVLVKLSAWKADFHPDHGSVARLTPKGLRIGPMQDTLPVENPPKQGVSHRKSPYAFSGGLP